MNYHMNKLNNILLELLNMLKTAEGAFKKEKCHVLLIQSSRMSKKKKNKNKNLVSKAKKPNGGIKIRVLIIIVAMMAIEGGIARNNLQL